MLAPLSWLKDYVDIDIPAEELKDKLFSCGFEVEELINIGKDISNVVVGEVLTCELIPDTHIHICKVDCADKGTFQICCGADNVKAGGKYPVALVGATVYATAKDHVTVEGVMTIKKGKLRGVDSEGMLCSGVEIGVTEDMFEGAGYNGLLVLPKDSKPGSDIKPIVGLDEYIFDISVTANRPDCQSIIGIAREVAAVLNKPFKLPPLDFTTDGKDIDFKITVEDPDLCPRYIGHYVSDIKIGKSPAWLRRRLSLVNINSISNIVDITNYVLKEFGQPMHAFDLSNLEKSEIVVRRAHDKEKITTLDEKEFELSSNNLVICDGVKPVALAGIMGGLNSEIKDTTKDVMFEAAKFARDNVRKTSRSLGQISDSSLRYEKGVDEYSTRLGMNRALNLICKLGCGKVSKFEIEVAENKDILPHPVSVSVSKINEIAGIEIPNEKILYHLNSLGFSPKIENDNLTVMVPAYREDIEDNVQDIAEEIIRLYGYDHIVPRFLNSAQVTCGGRNESQKLSLSLKNVLCTQGYYESVFYSFFSQKDLDMLHIPDDDERRNTIRLLNPISEDISCMRTMLAPSMINAAVKNMRKGNNSGRFFELANIFKADSLPLKDYPKELPMLCICAFGDDETFFSFKGALCAIEKHFDVTFSYKKASIPFLHPGISAEIFCQNEKVGYIGKVAYDICDELAVDKPIFIAELDYTVLSKYLNTKISYVPISKFPVESRDLALVSDEKITCEEITNSIISSCKYISSVNLFDIYRGKQIGEGKKSMAFNIIFTPSDHEFSGDEIDKYIQKILRKLEFTLGITLR